MTPEIFGALVALSIATLFTPGPNNTLLATSGANFGFRRTMPHLVGVAAGFPLMVLIVGILLAGLFQTSAILREGLRWGGALLLLYIAWKVAHAGSAGSGGRAVRPMTLGQAAAFQWINPKAWSMAVAATSQFIRPDAPYLTAGIVSATFLILGFISAALWTLGGQAIARWLTSERRLRVFNLTMAALIVLSVFSLVRH